MKKLLLSLNSIILISTSAHYISACNNKIKNNQNENNDSIWAWIPGIFNGKKITSPNVWNVLKNPFINIEDKKWTNNPAEWDGPTKIKMSVQLMQILSVAILANSDKLFSINNETQKNTNDFNIADYKDLKNILKKQWQLLIISTNNTVEKKKQSFKDIDKKKWEKKYQDFLNESNYKDTSGAIGKKKYEIEEQNYKADIMTTGTDGGISATEMLTNVLLNNNMRIYKQNTTISSVEILKNFANFLKNGNEIKNWNNKNQNLRIQLALSFNWNKDKNSFNDDLNDLTINKINDNLDKISKDLKKYNYDYLSYISDNNTPVITPVFENSTNESIGIPSLSETYDIGQLSLFQKYMIEKWFKNEKPLAISKITYSFKSGLSPNNNGFTKDIFEETIKKQINKDLKLLNESKNWNDFIINSENDMTPSSDLLTLNSQTEITKSNILKSSVYNSIDSSLETLPLDINGIINKINRKNIFDPISANWKIGTNNDFVIGFFDTNGFNLIHIDGNEFLKNSSSTSYKNYDTNWQFKSLNYSSNVFDIMEDKSNIIKSNQEEQMINTQFSNTPYLWYLINRSIINNNNNKLKFKILDEIKKYAVLNSGSGINNNKTWWFWIYDFFNNFINKILIDNLHPQEWLKKFITFKNSDGQNNIDWFISIINAMSSNLSIGALQNLYNNFEIENKIIENYKINGPSAKINTKSIIDKINNSKIWSEEIEENNSTINYSKYNSSWIYKFPNLTIKKPKNYYYEIGDKE